MQTKLVAYFKITHKNLIVWTLILQFHYLIKKELSDFPEDSIRLAVSFLYGYVNINIKILKCTVK
jgi:hypothetical protein